MVLILDYHFNFQQIFAYSSTNGNWPFVCVIAMTNRPIKYYPKVFRYQCKETATQFTTWCLCKALLTFDAK